MRPRIGKQRDQRQQLGEATRPAMTENQRDPHAPLAHEMDANPIDLGPELGETVQCPSWACQSNTSAQYPSSPSR